MFSCNLASQCESVNLYLLKFLGFLKCLNASWDCPGRYHNGKFISSNKKIGTLPKVYIFVSDIWGHVLLSRNLNWNVKEKRFCCFLMSRWHTIYQWLNWQGLNLHSISVFDIGVCGGVCLCVHYSQMHIIMTKMILRGYRFMFQAQFSLTIKEFCQDYILPHA